MVARTLHSHYSQLQLEALSHMDDIDPKLALLAGTLQSHPYPHVPTLVQLPPAQIVGPS